MVTQYFIAITFVNEFWVNDEDILRTRNRSLKHEYVIIEGFWDKLQNSQGIDRWNSCTQLNTSSNLAIIQIKGWNGELIYEKNQDEQEKKLIIVQ